LSYELRAVVFNSKFKTHNSKPLDWQVAVEDTHPASLENFNYKELSKWQMNVRPNQQGRASSASLSQSSRLSPPTFW
jgi:hypothetical protein